MEATHDWAVDVEIAATVKLRKIQQTTIAGVMAVTAYFAEHMDRYPGCGVDRRRVRVGMRYCPGR
jgi:hypothetical protein